VRFSSYSRILGTAWLLATCLLAAGVACAEGPSKPVPSAAPPAVAFGEPFPPAQFAVLNAAEGAPSKIDLATVLGHKPVVLFYWIAGHPRADEAFVELQKIQREVGKEKFTLLGVAIQQPGRAAPEIRKRLTELGIDVPVLDDEGFRLGTQLRVQTVPNITLIDREGNLRMTNGASLSQVVGYEMDVAKLIRRLAERGTIGTLGYLDTYYPVMEMVGKPCPDFRAPMITNQAEQDWSSILSREKLNVLIFWSVDCPHCRKSMPEINDWLKANAGVGGLNVVSAARVPNETVLTKTKEYCQINDFVFPTLVDDQHITDLYQVTSTPTIVFIRPDGVIDSVMLNAAHFGERVTELKKKLL